MGHNENKHAQAIQQNTKWSRFMTGVFNTLSCLRT